MQFLNNSNYIIGIDFDNTLVSYDHLIYEAALKRGLIEKNIAKNKKKIRDSIRKLYNGDIEWQKIQAFIYGPGIREASMIQGVTDFLEECKRRGITVYIISHKTKYAGFDQGGVNLRKSALAWIKENDLLNSGCVRLENIYFESTRKEKIDRIISCQCTHFIDDLEEMFLEEVFPEGVQKILYAPNKANRQIKDVLIAESWSKIFTYFFVSSAAEHRYPAGYEGARCNG